MSVQTDTLEKIQSHVRGRLDPGIFRDLHITRQDAVLGDLGDFLAFEIQASVYGEPVGQTVGYTPDVPASAAHAQSEKFKDRWAFFVDALKCLFKRPVGMTRWEQTVEKHYRVETQAPTADAFRNPWGPR